MSAPSAPLTGPTFPDVSDLAPVTRPVDATARVPGSKSITNRVLLVAALADGPSQLTGAVGRMPSSPVANSDHMFYYGYG